MPANTSNTILSSALQRARYSLEVRRFAGVPHLLQERRLWFTRMDLLGDSFEGSIETRVLDNVPLAEAPDMPTSAKPTIERLQRQVLRNFIRTQKMSSFISCWTEEERELMALWRSYKRSDYSVAIRTTYSTLRDQLPGNVLLGKVFYTDFLQPIDHEMIKNNLLYYAIRKHEGFKFEREVRAVIYAGMKNLQTILDATKKKARPFQQITEFPFQTKANCQLWKSARQFK